MLFEKLGRLIVRHSKLVLFLFIISILTAGGFGSLLFNNLAGAGYSDPKSDSVKVAQYLEANSKNQEPAAILIVDAQDRSVDNPTVVNEVKILENEISHIQNIERIVSYWNMGQLPNFLSKDGNAAYMFIYPNDNKLDTINDIGREIQKKFDGKFKSLKIYATGTGVINHALNSTIKKDLAVAEIISIPITFLILLFVFGAVVASMMPIFVGICSILGAFFVLYIITSFTSVSVFALNLVTGMGLGLGIDYSLLMVNRFREELYRGKNITDSVLETIKTAGKTVFYSGLTVMVTLSSLMFFPQPFLKSFGYAGVSVVFLAVLSTILPLPALMMILRNRVNKGLIRKSVIHPKQEGKWSSAARMMMRYAIPVILVSFMILTVLILPIKNLALSQTDVRVLPKNNSAVIADRIMNERFPNQESIPIDIIVPNVTQNSKQVEKYIISLANINGVTRINPPQKIGNDIQITAIQNLNPRSDAAKNMIHDIRSLKDAPKGTLVGGLAADYTDSQDAIQNTLPFAFGWIAVSVLILIFIFTGSILLPIKAVFLNALSLAATLGVLTYIFIDGHLKWLIGDFIVTGALDTGTSIMVAVVVFGLSMDYELFLLSRIKEEHLSGKNNQEAVAVGLQKSARIITAAALILAVVFAAFVTSGITVIKLMGFGTAFAILLDATLIRILLVPALMKLFGEWNWWAPKFLKRFTLNH